MNVNAPLFIPKQYVVQSSQMNVNAPQFIPRQYRPIYRPPKNVVPPPPRPPKQWISPIKKSSKYVQTGDEVFTELDLRQYSLVSEIEDFWSADIRHVGIQVTLKEIKSDMFSHTDAPISYSAVLQGKAKPIVKVDKRLTITPLKLEDSDEDENNIPTNSTSANVTLPLSKKQKQKLLSKNKPSPLPTLLDFVSTSKQKTPKTPAKTKLVEEKPKSAPPKPSVARGNILDSSEPQFHKGKTRENAKKKPTTMKKIILKEREEKKNRLNSAENNGENNETVSQDVQPPSSSEIESAVQKLHSRNFRSYCDNVITDELNEAVTALISELGRFQDRQYAKDPEKAKLKRRMVYGLRQVKKLVKVEKIQFVVVAPNMEQVESEGGLIDLLGDILDECRQQNVPYAFALSRQRLGFITHKHRPIAVLGVLNYQGAEQYFKRIVELLEHAKTAYQDLKRSNEDSGCQPPAVDDEATLVAAEE